MQQRQLKPQGMISVVLVFLLTLTLASSASAASTTKTLSTNFTLINFGSSTANVAVEYLEDTGSSWAADSANTSFTIGPDGGQKIIRQYTDSTMTSGRGSAVVSSTEPLGAVVQIRAIGQTPTSGAYSGFASTSDTYYIPLVARRLNTASGLGNSQIMVQNADTNAATVDIQLIGSPSYTKSGVSIPASSTYYYDLDDESEGNVPSNWFGAAVVSASGGAQIAVVSNFFLGPHAMQTFNAFPAESLGTEWLVPLFTSRLANGLSTPVAVQNLSGGTIGAGGVTMDCIKDPGSPGSDFAVSNTSSIADNAAYYFNPVTDLSLPEAWYGACRVSSTGSVVAFVQMRFIGTDQAAAYEAIRADGTDTVAFIPLVAKRLANGFATAVTIQNLSPTDPASVTFTYVPSPDYVAGGGSSSNIVVGPYSIPAGGSLIHNHRLGGTGSGSGQHNLPDEWYGSLVVDSSDQPINGFVQLTNIYNSSGDDFMAHDAFTFSIN